MKNKKLFGLLLLPLLFTACGKTPETPPEPESVSESVTEEEAISVSENLVPPFVPELASVKAICELSTLKCIYHNVASGVQYAGTGLAHAGEKDRKFMQEYDCEVEISYPVNEIKMEQNENEIRITLPEPVITSRKLPESINADSYKEEPDQALQKNPILAETIGNAVNTADAAMEEEIRNNSSLLQTAENQARSLIENYIRQIGNLTDVEYRIIWE